MRRLDLAFAARFLAALAALLAVVHLTADRIEETLIPVFRWEIETLQNTYRIRKVGVESAGADRVVCLDVGIARMMVVADKVLDDDPRNRVYVSMLAANVYVPTVLGLSLMLAWPAASLRHIGRRLLLGLLLLACIVLVDVPFVLLGLIRESLLMAAAGREFSLLVTWQVFLQGGGRYVLAVAAAAGAVMMGADG